MQSRRTRRRGVALSALSTTLLPVPALASEGVLDVWGPYLFFAIAVTLVVVLLLHEVLDEHSTTERTRDPTLSRTPGERR